MLNLRAVASFAVMLACVTSILASEKGSTADAVCQSISEAEYTKWLTEDVIDLFTDGEYAFAQFIQTASGQERCAFVRQFWTKRNPYPDLDRNFAYLEHYRRKWYADRHFATEKIPGSRTDRGRVFVLLGPPQCTRLGWPSLLQGGDSYPFEVWTYQNCEVRGRKYPRLELEFVDPGMEGSYRLVSSLDGSVLRTLPAQ